MFCSSSRQIYVVDDVDCHFLSKILFAFIVYYLIVHNILYAQNDVFQVHRRS